jgi:hypothetical protein
MTVGLDRLALAVEPEDLAAPGRGADEPEQQTDGGRFARSVRTQVTDDLALVDFEVEMVESGNVSVAFGEALRMDR